MEICKLDAEMLVLTTLLEGQLERALGMASFAIVQTSDETAENYVQRIKDEALDRLVLAHNPPQEEDYRPTVEELQAAAPQSVMDIVNAVPMPDPMPDLPPVINVAAVMAAPVADDNELLPDGPDDRLQAQRDAEMDDEELLF
jgi:hypothetical protein